MKIDWDAITNTKRDKSTAERIREASRMTYGKPLKEVEEYINEKMGFNEPTEEKIDNPFKPASKLPF
jgi:hypothetical protein